MGSPFIPLVSTCNTNNDQVNLTSPVLFCDAGYDFHILLLHLQQLFKIGLGGLDIPPISM